MSFPQVRNFFLERVTSGSVTKAIGAPFRAASAFASEAFGDRHDATAVRLFFGYGVRSSSFEQRQLGELAKKDPVFAQAVGEIGLRVRALERSNNAVVKAAQIGQEENRINWEQEVTQATQEYRPQYIQFAQFEAPAQATPVVLEVPQANFSAPVNLLAQPIKGLAKRGIESAIKKGAGAIAKTATSTAVKGAAKAVAAKGIGAAIGTAIAPGIGTVVIPALLELGGKVLGKIKDLFTGKNKDTSKLVIFGFFAGGILIGGPIGMGMIALGTVAGVGVLAASAGGPQGLVAQAGGFTNALVTGFLAVVVPSIAIPLTIAIITIVSLFSVIFFIIRSNAFIAPRQETTPTAFIGIPAEDVCMPATGTITQEPFCESHTNSSHCKGLNAYDIAGAYRSPIYAVHSGTAYSYSGRGYGNYIVIVSDDGSTSTLYGHMVPNFIIPEGTSKHVSAGEIIGRMGSTGNSTGVHVHFELLTPKGTHIKELYGEAKVGDFVQHCFAGG